MKTRLLVLISCLGIFFSVPVFAGCGSSESSCSSSSYSSYSNEGSYYSCQSQKNPCDCVDPACTRNRCMSESTCCEAFGNIATAW